MTSAIPVDTLASVLKKWLTPANCEKLDLDGYLVLNEKPLSGDLAAEFLREIKHCFHNVEGGKIQNQVEFLTSEGPLKLNKPHIFECDLHQRNIRCQLPLFDDLFNHQLGDLVELFRDRFTMCEDLVPFDNADDASKAITLKLQMNEGGAFPWHYDNPSRPNKRRLTMAVYLTDEWAEGMGGEIVLWPFLDKPVKVNPSYNTVVFFKSDMTLHKVLPVQSATQCTRYCFTIWFDGFMTNTDEEQFLKVSHLQESAIPLLKRTPLQRTLSRAVYDEEYRTALRDCFGDGSVAYKISLHEHNARLAELLKNEKVRQFVEELKLYRGDR